VFKEAAKKRRGNCTSDSSLIVGGRDSSQKEGLAVGFGLKQGSIFGEIEERGPNQTKKFGKKGPIQKRGRKENCGETRHF